MKSFEPVGSIEMRTVCNEEEIDYMHILEMLVPQAEELVGLNEEYELSFCCLGHPCDCFISLEMRLTCRVSRSSNAVIKRTYKCTGFCALIIWRSLIYHKMSETYITSGCYMSGCATSR